MQVADLGPWVLGAGGMAVALAAVWKIAAAVARFARRVGHFLDDWWGEPERPGHPARPGIPERMAGVEKNLGEMCGRLGQVEVRTARIEHELHPNSGHTMRDAMDRVETTVQAFTPPPDTDVGR